MRWSPLRHAGPCQYRLKSLVDSKRLVMEGKGRWARYRVPRVIWRAVRAGAGNSTASARLEVLPPLSEPGAEIQEYVRRPPEARMPVGYDRAFSIRTGPTTPSISRERTERSSRRPAGRRSPNSPGTYAKQI